MTMNHSVTFVDPVTGVHTNHIDSYWNCVKQKLKRMKGCARPMLAGYLDEFMWRERYGSTRREAFDNLCRDIALWYGTLCKKARHFPLLAQVCSRMFSAVGT